MTLISSGVLVGRIVLRADIHEKVNETLIRSLCFASSSLPRLCFASPVVASGPDQPASGLLTLEDVRAARQTLIDLTKPREVLLNAACCKVWRKGKACGDSCISCSYRCHKGIGCACDG